MAKEKFFSDPAMAQSQDFSTIELHLVSKAAGTKHTVDEKQASAEDRVYVMIGNGTVDMTSAEANKLVEDELARDLDTDRTNLSTGMVTYFTNIPAAADDADAIAFAFGGIKATDIIEVEYEFETAGTAAANQSMKLRRRTSQVIRDIVLDGSTLQLQDGTTDLVYGTHQLVHCPNQQVIFGNLTLPDVADVPAADLNVVIRLKVK